MAEAAKDGAKGAPPKTERRDKLLALQAEAQKRWDAERTFEARAPAPGEAAAGKYFGTFPYPYMNGLLHLGHAFSLSKLEFASAYHRLLGERVLMPFGFHCTGMPIKAAADKLVREIGTYGYPPQFPPEEETEEEKKAAEAEKKAAADPTKFKAKKGKAAGKTVKAQYQYQIMQAIGVPEADIPLFRESLHWLEHFPPLGMRDVRAMGCGVDWRRTFITTDVNPYYDSFVRWQFNTLKRLGKVVKAKRYAVFSPLDGQPCADHDRDSGEGVGPQEYTVVKMRVLDEHLVGPLAPLAGRKVFLGPATLRPETMYGQTNCWVLPDGDYGCYLMAGGEVIVVSARAARNMSFQDLLCPPGDPECLLKVKGQDLIGIELEGPNAINQRLPVLPMLTILMDKGTGVVTSVPSDAPADFMCIEDLKKKAPLRAKYGVKDEQVMGLEPIPIINIPEFGDCCAPVVCEQLKIQSQNDKVKLEEAKDMTYLKGFTEGTMLVGAYKGRAVKDVKQTIKDELVAARHAIPYAEPERKVVSRSGDECVVALTDQWYLEYGEDSWRAQAEECLASMETYHEETRNGFEGTLGWLKQWACSRQFGLGTRVPWDKDFLIESLSDSTIYMAYYSVAHLLQGGDMYGRDRSGVPPEALTDAVWDAVFLNGPAPAGFPADVLEEMRREFNFWYPMDLRVSGKDLIQNHLTFSLYNHVAIFPREQWPKSFRTNGHLLLNGVKMSKSTGNFKTLEEAVYEYSADAMRFTLADAGDSMDDANYTDETAKGAILRLTTFLDWAQASLAPNSGLRTDAGDSFADRCFSNDMACVVSLARKAYDRLMFREALQAGFYELQAARDNYRMLCGARGMHRCLVEQFVEVQTRVLAPICPHTCEYLWREVLGKAGSVTCCGWPQTPAPDFGLKQAGQYLHDSVADMRKQIIKATAPPKKHKGPFSPKRATRASVVVAPQFSGWREVVLGVLRSRFDASKGTFPPEAVVLEDVKKTELAQQADFKQVMKGIMPFLKFRMAQANKNGAVALASKLPFDEAGVLRENAGFVTSSLGLEVLDVVAQGSPEAAALAASSGVKPEDANPGEPVMHFDLVEAPAEAKAAEAAPKKQKGEAAPAKPAAAPETPPKGGAGAGPRVLVPEGSAAACAVKLYASATGQQLSVAAGPSAAVEDGKARVEGLATSLRYLASVAGKAGARAYPNDARDRLRADEAADLGAALCAAADANDVAALRPLAARAERGAARGAAASPAAEGGVTIGDVLLAAGLAHAERALRAAGAQPALSYRCAALVRAWEGSM